jgi:hypothetical protein
MFSDVPFEGNGGEDHREVDAHTIPELTKISDLRETVYGMTHDGNMTRWERKERREVSHFLNII